MSTTEEQLINEMSGYCGEIRKAHATKCKECKGTGKTQGGPEVIKFLGESCDHCRGAGMVEAFWPRIVTDLEKDFDLHLANSLTAKRGDWVAVRSCSDKHGTQTYLGVMLGDLAISIGVGISEQTKMIMSPHHNPAMYVPDLKDIVWGCGSWWHKISKPEDLEQITDKDIQNVWYVKCLSEIGKKEMTEGEEVKK